MDIHPGQPQILTQIQINERLKELFEINELVEQSKNEIDTWNDLQLIEQNIQLRNQLILNIQSQTYPQIAQEEAIEHERDQINKQNENKQKCKLPIIRRTEKLLDKLINNLLSKKAQIYKSIDYYDKIPISFQQNSKITKSYNLQGLCEYKVQGVQQLFSIERIPISRNSKYKLELEVKNNSNQMTYTGFKSYYQNIPIYDIQSLISEQTDVKLISLDEQNKAVVVDNRNNNLSRWNCTYAKDGIGYYKTGDINTFLKQEEVIVQAVREVDLQNNKIYLTQTGWDQLMKSHFQRADLNQAVLMNHNQGNTYDYTEIIQTHYTEWFQRFYDIKSFRKYTDSIEICILANYQGQENQVFEFRNVNLIVCRDEE